MNLTDLQENKKSKLASKVLKESFDYDLSLSNMNIKKTSSMLTKVRGLIIESKTSTGNYRSHKNPAYMKLLMMEQALSGHLQELRSQTRIVVENEEVQKSQVILAAKSMIDDIQKMIEQVSKMNVEELNAVVESMKNSGEFGANEAEQFNSAAGEALSSLQEALKTAKDGLNGALDTVTGDGGMPTGEMGDMGDIGGPEGMDDMGGMEEPEMGGEMPELPEEPEEEPKQRMSGLGRERR
jgi:hypothetical protein